MKAFILALLAITAVTSIDHDATPTSTLQVPNGATSLSMVVSQDEVFNVQLNGNPTTGYQWILENNDQLSPVSIRALNLNNQNVGDFVKPNSGNSMVGVGGYYNFKFQAGKPSNDLITLNFVYQRLWESKAAKQVQVKVQIS